MPLIIVDLHRADFSLYALAGSGPGPYLLIEHMWQDRWFGIRRVGRVQALYIPHLDPVVAILCQFLGDHLRLQGLVAVKLVSAQECILAGAAQPHIDIPSCADARAIGRVNSGNIFAVLFVGFHVGAIQRCTEFRFVPIPPVPCSDSISTMLEPERRDFRITCLVDNEEIGDRGCQTKVSADDE